ncbi:MAG: hypothetical protein IJ507_05625 [Clostridia bacterium]|nr:hypothetical protein [Clostridia bacterium]
MNTIAVGMNPDTCYVYHMLAAAQCGYVNPYGAMYGRRYPAEQLHVLKQNEKHISVCGGEYCGKLYYPLIALPACGFVEAKQVYQAMTQTFADGTVSPIIPGWLRPKYEAYAGEIVAISRIMVQYYDDYCQRVYPQVKQEGAAYTAELQRLLDEHETAGRAARILKSEVKDRCFHVRLCPSMEKGPQAIDIAENIHVFGMHQSPEAALQLIVHEYIIALMKPLLAGMQSFETMENWKNVEGLAEYYCVQLLERKPLAMLAEVVKQYECIAVRCPGFGPADMLREILTQQSR